MCVKPVTSCPGDFDTPSASHHTLPFPYRKKRECQHLARGTQALNQLVPPWLSFCTAALWHSPSSPPSLGTHLCLCPSPPALLSQGPELTRVFRSSLLPPSLLLPQPLLAVEGGTADSGWGQEPGTPKGCGCPHSGFWLSPGSGFGSSAPSWSVWVKCSGVRFLL